MSLYDREYYRQSPGSETNGGFTALLWIIAANVLIFLLSLGGGALTERLALSCLPGEFDLWQMISYAFYHTDFYHLLFNMWGLYIFGTLVTPHLGGRDFLFLYLAGALSGSLLYLVFNWGTPGGMLGASGAVCAVMMAAALCEPDRRFMMIFLPFFPLRTRTLVVCYTVLELVFQFGGRPGDPIAHLAHLGGFLGGYLFIRLFFRRIVVWDPLARRNPASGGSAWRGVEVPPPPPPPRSGGFGDGPVSPAELDALLDKISREGINSLSEHELARLKRAREEMRGGSTGR